MEGKAWGSAFSCLMARPRGEREREGERLRPETLFTFAHSSSAAQGVDDWRGTCPEPVSGTNMIIPRLWRATDLSTGI